MVTQYNRAMQTPAATFYNDPGRLKTENEHVFAHSWQIVGHIGQLQGHGDYFTTRLGREPLLFVNDHDTIRGFFNVCRHRAGPVAAGCGHAERLVCRYHGWTYDLSGQLLRTTEMTGADFDPATIRLQSVAVHRLGPLLFAALDPDTPVFDTLFPGVARRCAPLGVEQMHHVTTRSYPVNANWKVYVDNFLEGYHIPLVHPSLNREIDYRQYITELGERHVLQYAPVREATATLYGGSGSREAVYYWLFPNIMLNIYEDQMQTNVVIPVDVDHTIVRFDWFAPQPLPDQRNDERWNRLVSFSEEVQAEDAGICEIVQLNIGSRAYRPGPYSPKRESGVHLFHTLMKAWG
jgi:choline monooxygenase